MNSGPVEAAAYSDVKGTIKTQPASLKGALSTSHAVDGSPLTPDVSLKLLHMLFKEKIHSLGLERGFQTPQKVLSREPLWRERRCFRC